MLRLRLETGDSQHERLVLTFGDWQHVCDPYYFELDRGLDKDGSQPQSDSPAARAAPGAAASQVRRVLVALLQQWKQTLAATEAGSECYLPFDFADQYTAWLWGRVVGDQITVQPGWSQVEGWSSVPSDIGASGRRPPDFEPLDDVPPLTAARSDWLNWIEASIVAACRGNFSGPCTDPTPIFEHFRGSYGSELLTAAVAHFNLFGRLAGGPVSLERLRAELGLAPRPMLVLTTAMRAMGLLDVVPDDRLCLTPLAREHLVAGDPYDVGDYIGLAAVSPGVLAMVERLRTNRPAGAADGDGVAFIYREGIASAMEQQQCARHFTLALAGRAKNVAPRMAEVAALDGVSTLLDLAGGTGLYALACLERYPQLQAIVLDRPEVLRVAAEFQAASPSGERLQLVSGDMFAEPLPPADAILLSNVLHDWDVPECRMLIARCAERLPPGGRLLIHDVFLSDALDGPLPIALYSAALFTLTEGRAYSTAEYRSWLEDAGLRVTGPVPTLIHCGLLTGVRPPCA